MKMLWKITKLKRLCYRPSYKIQNTLWEFHKGDCDDFPSVPHGHAIDKRNLKLSLWDGGIYEGTNRIPIGYVSTKEMKKLSTDRCLSQFVTDARQVYREITHREPPVLKQRITANNIAYRQGIFYGKKIFMSKDQQICLILTSFIMPQKRR